MQLNHQNKWLYSAAAIVYPDRVEVQPGGHNRANREGGWSGGGGGVEVEWLYIHTHTQPEENDDDDGRNNRSGTERGRRRKRIKDRKRIFHQPLLDMDDGCWAGNNNIL